MTKYSSVWKFAPALFAVSFGLNWIWEVGQMFAYSIKPEEIWQHVLFYCTLATVGDALVTIAGFGVVRIFTQNLDWSGKGRWKPYFLMSLFGAICAVFFEVFAIKLGLWKYNGLMPTVPLIEVGLLPLLQLTLLMPAALRVTVWLQRQKT